jgi:hypothetical protein
VQSLRRPQALSDDDVGLLAHLRSPTDIDKETPHSRESADSQDLRRTLPPCDLLGFSTCDRRSPFGGRPVEDALIGDTGIGSGLHERAIVSPDAPARDRIRSPSRLVPGPGDGDEGRSFPPRRLDKIIAIGVDVNHLLVQWQQLEPLANRRRHQHLQHAIDDSKRELWLECAGQLALSPGDAKVL